MKSLLKYKNTLFATIIFVAAIMIYNSFLKDTIFNTSNDEVAKNLGADLIDIYNDLQQVNFESELFRDPAYRELVDLSTTIAPLPMGRRNPFDLLGRD